MSNHQPTTGAVKLAKELETWPHPRHAAQIDRHVAPLIEALSDISKDAWSGDVTRLRTIAQSADAALQQWKDGKG